MSRRLAGTILSLGVMSRKEEGRVEFSLGSMGWNL